MELRDGDDRGGRTAGTDHVPRWDRPGQDGQHKRAVGERVPDVEIAEQQGDRERQDQRQPAASRPDRRRRPCAPRATAIRAMKARHQAAPPRRSPSRRGPRRSGSHVEQRSSPARPAAGTSRTGPWHRATNPASIEGSYGLMAVEDPSGRLQQQREVEARPWRRALPQRPSQPRKPRQAIAPATTQGSTRPEMSLTRLQCRVGRGRRRTADDGQQRHEHVDDEPRTSDHASVTAAAQPRRVGREPQDDDHPDRDEPGPEQRRTPRTARG